MAEKKTINAPLTRSQQEFTKARDEIKDLIRSVLKEERDVMHLRRRSDIHQTILDHVKRLIK